MGDSRRKGNRTKQKPLAKTARRKEYAPYPFGRHVRSLSAPWEVSRVPLACGLVKPTGSKGEQAEHALLRELLQDGVVPAGVKRVVVVAEAAYPARAKRQARPARQGFLVSACPRTGQLPTGQPLRPVVTPLPLHPDRKVRVPLLLSPPRRRVFWPVAQRAPWRQGGAVTVGLSRRRRTDSPTHPKLRVTKLPQATAPTPVAGYRRRGPVALFFQEGQGALGGGHHQVTQEAARVERAVAVALLADWLLLRWRAKHSKPGTSWSAFPLTPQFAWELGARQLKRVARQDGRKEVKLRLAAKEEVHLRLAA